MEIDEYAVSLTGDSTNVNREGREIIDFITSENELKKEK